MSRGKRQLSFRCIALVAFVATWPLNWGVAWSRSDTTATADMLAPRRTSILSGIVAQPFPNPDCSEERQREACVWGKLSYAIAALYLHRNKDEVETANTRIQEAVARIISLQADRRQGTLDPGSGIGREARNFYFLTSSLLARIYYISRMVDVDSGTNLAPANQVAIARAFWSYAQSECKVIDADPGRTWVVWGSENQHIMRATTCWAAAQILAEQSACGPCHYADGSSPATQLAAWTEFLKEYVRQRAKYGGFVEYFSQTYSKYSLQNFYVIAEYTRDTRLRELASGLIDVWWAEWAQEQVNGVHGGSKARAAASDDRMSDLAWYYFDVGARRPIRTTALILMITSRYEPPEPVRDFVARRVEMGTYEVWSRRTGLVAGASPGPHLTSLAPARGGVVRYAYSSPSFVMGAGLVPKLEASRWAPFSSQNRWSGLVVGSPGKHEIFARPIVEGGLTRDLNPTWCVQHKATQIIQKLQSPLSVRAGRMAIFVGDLKVEQQGDWLFIDAGAYVAVRPAFGGVVAGKQKGQFLLREDLAPVIIQAAERSDFASFADFKEAIMRAPLAVDGLAVRFQGLGGAGLISFFYSSERLPEIDGVAIELEPRAVFAGPILSGEWGHGVISIGGAAGRIVHDFRP